MPPVPNPFLWSHTRHETFAACPRRYYYAFYAAWGGWLRDPSPQTRLAYTLKRLLSRHDWISNHIVFALAELLATPPLDPAAFAAVAEASVPRKLETLRSEFVQSRNGLYRADPAHAVALFDHYYDIPVPPDGWRDTVNRLPLAVTRFSRSAFGQALAARAKSDFVFLNKPVVASLDGLTLRAHPHFILAEPDGAFRIGHFETDPSVPLASLRQRLLAHAVALVQAVPGVPLPVRASAHSPFFDETLEFAFGADELAQTREFIRDSAEEMLFPLADPASNDPGDGSAFEPIPPPPPAACAACNFRQICPFAPR